MNAPRVFLPVYCSALVALLALPVPVAAESAHARKVDRAVTNAVAEKPDEPLRVIVRARAGRRLTVAQRIQAHGDPVAATLTTIDAVTAEVHPEDIHVLAADEAVESISFDAPVSSSAIGEAEEEGTDSYVETLRHALGLGDRRPTGMGVGIAVIDSGIKGAYDVNISAFYEFEDGIARATNPHDDFGHGSHVSSLIGASGSRTGYTYSGVAPNVHLIGLKVLDKKGSGRTSDVIAAIEFAIAHRETLGIDVLNLSLGHPIYEPAASDPLVQAVEAASRAGLIVVVAAGNCGVMDSHVAGKCGNKITDDAGYAGITSPGNAPSAITVGASDMKNTATRSDDRVAFYSSRGPTWYDAFPKPDLVAPGHEMIANGGVKSPLYQLGDRDDRPTRVDSKFSRRLLKLSGTSMAAAMTSGVVALMIEANRRTVPQWYFYAPPPLTPNAVKAMLQLTATPLTDDYGVEYDALTQGVGELNAGGAVALARAVNTSAPLGSPWMPAGVTPETTFGAETLAWGQKIVWGYDLFSSNMLDFNDPAWASSVTWGDGSPINLIEGSGRTIVWGSEAVWAEKIVWGSGLVGTIDGEKIVWGYFSEPGGPGEIAWRDLARTLYSDGSKIVWGFDIF